MKETLFQQPPGLPETAGNNRLMHTPEGWAEAFELAAANSQEPWSGLALWFTNRNFLTRHNLRINPDSPKTEADSSL